MPDKEMPTLNTVHIYFSFAISKLQDLATIMNSIIQENWDILGGVPLIYPMSSYF